MRYPQLPRNLFATKAFLAQLDAWFAEHPEEPSVHMNWDGLDNVRDDLERLIRNLRRSHYFASIHEFTLPRHGYALDVFPMVQIERVFTFKKKVWVPRYRYVG